MCAGRGLMLSHRNRATAKKIIIVKYLTFAIGKAAGSFFTLAREVTMSSDSFY
jgi:hypothetical protein